MGRDGVIICNRSGLAEGAGDEYDGLGGWVGKHMRGWEGPDQIKKVGSGFARLGAMGWYETEHT